MLCIFAILSMVQTSTNARHMTVHVVSMLSVRTPNPATLVYVLKDSLEGLVLRWPANRCVMLSFYTLHPKCCILSNPFSQLCWSLHLPHLLLPQADVNILCRSNFDCVNNAECLQGQCYCRNGFKAVGAVCHDEDECQTSPCGPNAQCQNIPGSFQCTCNAGFLGNPPESECKG